MNTDDLSNWLRTSGPSLANLHAHLLMPGETVGPWRICSFLGQGGTSEVYRVSRGDDVEAALKIARDPEMTDIAARFKREGQLLRQLHSRHFATFFDEGVYGNHPYLVTELLQPLETPETDTAVAELALQLTDALGELHQLGYVHRDVKPANILTRDGHTPVLVDLGYAKPINPSATPIPQRTPLSQTVCQFFGLGTPGYAAPEQLTGDTISPAADIHALGVSLNDCFNGKPPSDWEPIIRRATSSLPSQRYASTQGFAEAIRHRHARRYFGLGLGLALATILGAFAIRLLILSVTQTIEDRKNHVYVSARAEAGGDGSREHPFNTISNALERVPWFGTITVAPGTYEGPVSICEKLVTLKSEQGPEKTIIRVDPATIQETALYVGSKGEGSTVDGLTLTGGKGVFLPDDFDGMMGRITGGGVACEASVALKNCRIIGNGFPNGTTTNKGHKLNQAGFGGGVFVCRGNVLLQDCVISNNFARYIGGGLCVEGKDSCLTLERCLVAGNRLFSFTNDVESVGGIAILREGSARLTDCQVLDNDAEQLGTLYGAHAAHTSLTVLSSRVAGGVHAGRIAYFRADPQSLEDSSTNTVPTAKAPPPAP